MEPLSLLAVGYSLVTADLARENSIIKQVSGKIFDSAVYGPLGNYTYDKLKNIYAHLQKGDEKNLNHDLQRAARKAQLTATLLAVRACLKETRRLDANEQSFWSKAKGLVWKDEDEKWLKELAELLQGKIDSLPKEVPPPIVEQDQIIGLFDPKLGLAPTDTQKKLIKKLQDDALREIRTEYYSASFSENAYKLLEEAIRTGWNESKDDKSTTAVPGLYPLGLKQALINTNKQYDWFSLVCGLFNEEYKTNERVEAAMQKYLLLDIRDRQGNVITDEGGKPVPVAAKVFFGHLEQFGDSFTRLEALLNTIDAKQDEILGFVKSFIEENRRLHKETQRVGVERIDRAEGVVVERIDRLEISIEEILENQRQKNIRVSEERDKPKPVNGWTPRPNLNFVNRDEQRRVLRERMRDGACPVVVVKGSGGYGKTALVTEFLNEVATRTEIKETDLHGLIYCSCDAATGDTKNLENILGKAEPIARLAT